MRAGSLHCEQKQKRLQQEEKQESSRQKTLARELEWIQMTPKGRHAKSKARLSNYDKLMSFKTEYLDDKIMPDVKSDFDRRLFNNQKIVIEE